MFVDKIKIVCKAGNGGSGAVSFLRDKFTAMGGPDGGDGGKGGDVFFKCTKTQNTLIDFYYQKKFFAGNGEGGSGKNKTGKDGADLTIEVPVGTIIKNAQNGEVVADLCEEGTTFKVLSGGHGGRGNARFTSSTRQAPGFSELGEETKSYEFELELKYIADVGLIGFPNTGKSTILSVISSAKPKIANYHFTTLSPNLGVVKYFENSFVVADIPGLIEGASEGAGLGHDFLRHIERTRLLCNVVDASGQEGRDPIEDIKTINNELCAFSKKLAKVPQIIVLNKIDLTPNVEYLVQKIKADKKIKCCGICLVSGATLEGIENFKKVVFEKLKTIPVENYQFISEKQIDERDISSIKIDRDEEGNFVLSGGYIDRLKRKIVLTDYQSFAYFQKRLKEDGVIELLKERGMVEGDTVKVEDTEFEFFE